MKTVNIVILLTTLVLIADRYGVAEAMRMSCQCGNEEKFVCGSNGLAFKNACYLECCTDGTASIAHEGRCERENFAKGCKAAGEEVCGYDGITYPSDCHARQAGLCIKRREPCPKP